MTNDTAPLSIRAAALLMMEHGGLVPHESMPSSVRSVAVRAADQFKRAAFSKHCRAFADDGATVHPATIIGAADRLLSEGDHWEGEREEWDEARNYVQRLVRLRDAMKALQEAAAEFDYQAGELGISPADRHALIGRAIAKQPEAGGIR